MCGSDKLPGTLALFSGYIPGILPRLPDTLVLNGVFVRTADNTHVFYQEALAKGLRPDVMSAVGLSPVENFTGNGKAIAERKHELDQNI